MCVIVDNNVAATLLLGATPVRQWLFGQTGKPRLVLGGKLDSELRRNLEVLRQLVELERAGRLRVVQPAIHPKIAGLCRSNDTHVIGLALASGARTLCTDDRDLIQDFRNPKIIKAPRGNVYSKLAHRRLLRHTGSCGMG